MATTVGGGFVYTSIVGPQGLDSVSGSGPPSPVLLPDLVAGWSLTSGPQQTLDSTGVISGGALDLTNLNGVAFGASGAVFDGVTADQALEKAAPATALDPNTSSWLAAFEFVPDNTSTDAGQVGLFGKENGPDNNCYDALYSTPTSAPDPGDIRIACNADADLDKLVNPAFVQGRRYQIFMWRDMIASTLNIQIDANAPQSVALVGSSITSLNNAFDIGTLFQGNNQLAMKIRHFRMWIGPNAVTIGNSATWLAWIANVVAGIATGRTDSEIAAYTG